MTKSEFMAAFAAELRRRNVAEADDIEAEYAQHFDFRLADGYSEEETAARLGSPAELAAQFASAPAKGGAGALTMTGLGFAGLFGALLFVILAAFGLVLAAAAIAFAASGVCLILGESPFGLIPYMPWAPALILGLAMLALAVLTACGCVWYAAFLRQGLRAFARFRENALSQSRGGAALPGLPVWPKLKPGMARALRKTALVSLIVFAVLLAAGMAAAMISAGAAAFWHTWGWFGGV